MGSVFTAPPSLHNLKYCFSGRMAVLSPDQWDLCSTALLHNLKYDEQIASFANASGVGAKAGLLLDPTASKSPGGSACTAIAFRTGAAGRLTPWLSQAVPIVLFIGMYGMNAKHLNAHSWCASTAPVASTNAAVYTAPIVCVHPQLDGASPICTADFPSRACVEDAL